MEAGSKMSARKCRIGKHQKLSGPPTEAGIAQDWDLIGLLTLASNEFGAAFPEKIPVAKTFQLYAITVAGQWRIFTALPVHQTA